LDNLIRILRSFSEGDEDKTFTDNLIEDKDTLHFTFANDTFYPRRSTADSIAHANPTNPTNS
jgi:hypothetical protein